MLKITRTHGDAGITLRLEGKLMGPWTEALLQACSSVDGAALRLDLSDVSYADDEGLRLLQSLRQRGVAIGPCSTFINTLLACEKHS
jgi:anti-anti-sigma regulatory factor